MSTNRTSKWIGLFLVGIGVLMGIFAIISIVVGRTTDIVTVLAYVGIAGVLGMSGMAFLFLHELGPQIESVVGSVSENLEDDFEALFSGHLTWTHGYVLLTLAATIISVWLMSAFHKWGASWYGVPVWIIGMVVAVVTSYLFTLSEWFKNRWERSNVWLFFVPAIGLVLCAILGLYMTEPVFSDHRSESSNYSYSDTRIGYWYYNYYPYYFDGNGSSNSSSSSGSSCNKCGEGLIFLIILVAVLAFIVCSATIPHFWVVALIILSCWLAVITWRELLYIPYQKRRRRQLSDNW